MLSSMGGLSPNAEAEAAPCGAHAASSKAGQSTQAAANVVRFMDRFLFGSSYPLVPLGEAVDNVRAWKLDPACEQRVLHDTAAELLSWKF